MRKSGCPKLIFTGRGLLAKYWDFLFGSTQRYLFHPCEETFTCSHVMHLVLCTDCRVSTASAFLRRHGRKTLYSARSCTWVNQKCFQGKRDFRLMFQTHASSPSTHMLCALAGRREGWPSSTERIVQVSESTVSGSSLLKMEQDSWQRPFVLGSERQNKITRHVKVNRGKAKWGSRDF